VHVPWFTAVEAVKEKPVWPWNIRNSWHRLRFSQSSSTWSHDGFYTVGSRHARPRFGGAATSPRRCPVSRCALFVGLVSQPARRKLDFLLRIGVG
jgi:hypothetical protein